MLRGCDPGGATVGLEQRHGEQRSLSPPGALLALTSLGDIPKGFPWLIRVSSPPERKASQTRLLSAAPH